MQDPETEAEMIAMISWRTRDGKFLREPVASERVFVLMSWMLDRWDWRWIVETISRWCLYQASNTVNRFDQDNWIARAQALREAIK